MLPYPTTRAEISRSRLIGNFEVLRAWIEAASVDTRCDLMAVVKGNAYGNGVSLCAPWLADAGAEWLGVTSAEEGAAVRRLCPFARILVMRCLLRSEVDVLLDARLVPTVWELAQLDWLADAAANRDVAAASIPIHLEIDSGMTRQGVGLGELAQFLRQLSSHPALRLEGVYTHFASPEMLDAEQNRQQWMVFERAVESVFATRFRPQWIPQWIHAGNSSSVLSRQIVQPLSALAAKMGVRCMMRPGIALYGYASPFMGAQTEAAESARAALQPVLAWKTEIASLRDVGRGAQVGYDATFTAPRRMRLALLPIGYADGLNRKLSGGKGSNGGHVLVRGETAPVVGRISMDLTVVDVSHAPEVAVGDTVTILGEQDGLRITADDHARWAETIPYEILCGISARVPRVPAE
jgi:alanine racemase